SGGCPTVRNRIVSPAIVQSRIAAPHHHFTAPPYCRVPPLSSRGISGASAYPTICAWIVSPAGVEVTARIFPAPDDHLIASPNRSLKVSGLRNGSGAGHT